MKARKKSSPLEVCLCGLFVIVLGLLMIVVVPRPVSDFSDISLGVVFIISGIFILMLNFFRSTTQLQVVESRLRNCVQSKVFTGLIVAGALFGIVPTILEMLGE